MDVRISVSHPSRLSCWFLDTHSLICSAGGDLSGVCLTNVLCLQAKDSDDDEEVVQVDRDHFMDEFFEQVRLSAAH